MFQQKSELQNVKSEQKAFKSIQIILRGESMDKDGDIGAPMGGDLE